MKLKHRSRDEEVADRVVAPDFVCRDPSGKEDFALELVFNGEVFEDRKDQLCTVNGLVPGHRIELEFINGTAFFPNRTGVDVTVFSDTDEDVTDNYEITQNGWTEFRKQPLMVDCADVNVVYDGEEHKGSYTVTGLLDCDEIEQP